MRIDLPFELGDDLWWVDSEDNEIRCEKGGIRGVAIRNEKTYIIGVDGEMFELHSQWGCLTKEEAETIRRNLFN